MNPKNYVKNVLITESRDTARLVERFSNSRNIRLMHGILGLSSELAEIREAHGQDEIDAVNLKEEMGDLYWYIGIMIDELQVDPDTVLTVHSINEPGYTDPEARKEMLGHAIDVMTVQIGEASDLLKKAIIYGKPLDEQKLAERLKNLDFWIAHSLFLYQIKPGDSRETNIAKLKARYGDKFTEAAALERDLAAERAILEKNNG